METSIRDGVSFTAIEFLASTDADKKYDEVTRELNALRPEFPPETQIIVRKFSPGLVNTVQIALVSDDAPYRELEDYARELKDKLKTVEGVRTSESWAYPERELRIAVDLRRMSELNLVARAGHRRGAEREREHPRGLRRPRAAQLLAEDLRQLHLARPGARHRHRLGRRPHRAHPRRGRRGAGAPRRTATPAATRANARCSSPPTRKTATTSSTCASASWRRPNHFAADLPKRIKLEVGFDQSENVRTRLNRLYFDFGIAISLVLLTLLPLGWRAAGIVMVSIPLSLSFGLACLYFLDYSLNQLSIAGFVVALGLLVDDSIVVVENIARHMRMGKSRMQAALDGTRQIFVAILGCTATLIFAFLPLLALPGTAGQIHPRAADGGGGDHHRLAAAGAVHHPVRREPRASGREGRPGESVSSSA